MAADCLKQRDEKEFQAVYVMSSDDYRKNLPFPATSVPGTLFHSRMTPSLSCMVGTAACTKGHRPLHCASFYMHSKTIFAKVIPSHVSFYLWEKNYTFARSSLAKRRY
jgi:hypothetical protein